MVSKDNFILSISFAKAYALPEADYTAAQSTGRQGMLVDMYAIGKTNSASDKPIVGTYAIDPCVAVIAYNETTKTAAVYHNISKEASYIVGDLSHAVRNKESESVTFHVIGASFDQSANKDYTLLQLRDLSDLAQEIESLPNAKIQTFDVFGKGKTHAVAIDARTGELIRGTSLYNDRDSGSRLDDNFSYPCAWDIKFFDNSPQ